MKKFLLKVFKVLFAVLGLGMFAILIAKSPEIHSAILRNYAGSKTVMIHGVKSGGSGFFVENEEGKVRILTNKHVCATGLKQGKYKYLMVMTKNGQKRLRRVIKESDKHDLCLVEGFENVSGLEVASELNVGDTVAIVGHPKLAPLSLFKGEFIGSRVIQIITGINMQKRNCSGVFKKVKNPFLRFIGVKTVCITNYDSNQITAYSRGGSSGSPVVNFYGDVVGVLFAGNRKDQFESFMVPLEEIKRFLEFEGYDDEYERFDKRAYIFIK